MENKKIFRLLFLGVLLVQLIMLIYIFQVKKEGWHTDEIFSYGYANSHFMPNLYLDVESGVKTNKCEWIDTKVLNDYITVNKGEQFDYSSVLYNVSCDWLHVPLYYVVLHTICSFFPGKFSFWFAFSINLVSYVLLYIFLWKLCALIKNDKYALLVCAFYGFSAGAFDNFIYLRMYAMETTLLVMMLYFMLKVLRKGDKITLCADVAGLFITSVLGFATHYHFTAIAGILTFLFCIYLFFKKNYKKMLQFGLLMTIALITVIPVYINFIGNIHKWFNKLEKMDANVQNWNSRMRFIYILNLLFNKEFNIKISWYRSGNMPVIIGGLIYGLICLIPLLIFLRNTSPILKLRKSVNEKWVNRKAVLKNCIRKTDWEVIIIGLASLLQIILISQTSEVAGMNVCADRYIFCLFPLVVFVVLVFVHWVIVKLLGFMKKKKKMAPNIFFVFLVGIVMVINLVQVFKESVYYFESDTEGRGLYAETEHRNVVIIEEPDSLLNSIIPFISGSNHFFHVNISEYELYLDSIAEWIDKGPMVLVINKKNFYSLNENREYILDEEKYQSVLDYFEAMAPDTQMQYLTAETVYLQDREAYLINP